MQHKGRQIHPFCAEPDGGCAVTFCEVSDSTRTAKCAWQRMGDDAQKVRYSPTATVRAFRASQAMGRAQRDAGG